MKHTDDTWSLGKLTLSMGLDGVGLGCCVTVGNFGPGGGGGGSGSSGGEDSLLCCS